MLAQFTSVVSSDSFGRLTRASLAQIVATSDDTSRECGIIISLAQAKQQSNVRALIDGCIGATIVDHDGQTMIVNKQDNLDNEVLLAHKFGEVLALEEARDKQNKKIENNEKLLKLIFSKIEKLEAANSALSALSLSTSKDISDLKQSTSKEISALKQSNSDLLHSTSKEISALKQSNSSQSEQLSSQHSRLIVLESLNSVLM